MRKFSILFLILAILTNTVLMKYGIEGIPRDLSRLCVLVAFALLIVSLFKKKKA
jgi:uncharacterized membrane protein YtjA (UPF0391 family)